MTHAPLDAKYSVHDRLRKHLAPSDDWHCPCHCVAPEIGVFRMDDGDLRLCWTCLEAGYACRLYHERRCHLCLGEHAPNDLHPHTECSCLVCFPGATA